MEARSSVFMHSAELEKYDYPPECPFSSRRAVRTRDILAAMNLLEGPGRSVVAPQPAPRDELLKFHAAHYLDILQRASRGIIDETVLFAGLGTPDCPLFIGMYEYATLCCGASLQAAERILRGETRVAFNPSGGYHHAMQDSASGFCYINDVVIACLKLADSGKRVFFLDVDAHHADGVQAAFWKRRDVMTVSFHESGKTLFPGTGFEDEIGEGEGRGYAVNLPLPVGTYDEVYWSAFREIVLPLLRAYQPDVIVLELGMDGLAGDPLTHLHLTNNLYADIIGSLLKENLPILATGGGGYNHENTARGWALCYGLLSGALPDEDLSFGIGGVMLQSSEWLGGLRDRALLADGGQRPSIDQAIGESIRRLKTLVFPLHGLSP